MAIQFPVGGALGVAACDVADRVRESVAEIRSRGGAGAGTVWRPDGIVVTNHHVVPGDGAGVTIADGRSFAGQVVARDPGNDLAILKVAATDLAAATIGDARALRAGELVVAVGHPFGLRGAVTVGVVSTVRAQPTVGADRELIRADVLLGPGNSGGPLADARGQVVGINAMVAGGLALAVPSHVVERLLGEAGERPRLGIAAQDVELPPALADRVGADRGALVVQVQAGGPADAAGVLIGDVVLGVGGRPVRSVGEMLGALAERRAGPLNVELLRAGERRVVVVSDEAGASRRRAA